MQTNEWLQEGWSVFIFQFILLSVGLLAYFAVIVTVLETLTTLLIYNRGFEFAIVWVFDEDRQSRKYYLSVLSKLVSTFSVRSHHFYTIANSFVPFLLKVLIHFFFYFSLLLSIILILNLEYKFLILVITIIKV